MNASPPAVDLVEERAPVRPARWPNRLDSARPAIVAFIIYCCLRQFILGRVPPVWFSDSEGYIEPYRNGTATGFLGQGRPWAYPLFLWLTGYHFGLAVLVQRLAGTVAWFALARAAAGLYRAAALRRFVFYVLLVLSLTLYAIQWDVMVLTESLTLSCFLLLSAAWFRLLHTEGAGLSWLATIAALAFPLAGLRDASIPLLLVFAAAAGALVLARFLHQPRAGSRPVGSLLAGLALSGMLAFCAFLHQRDIQSGHRGVGNLDHVLNLRAFIKDVDDDGSFATDTDNIEWLARNYTLPSEEAMERAGSIDADAPPLSLRYRAWLENTGIRAWTDFLLHHPGWLWSAYHGYSLYDVSDSVYTEDDPEKWRTAHLGLASLIHGMLYGGLSWLFNMETLNSLLLLGTGLLAAAWLASWRWRLLHRHSAPLGALFWICSVAALAPLIAFVGDTIETWRHALIGLIALYIMIPLALALLAEMGICWLGRRKVKVAGTSVGIPQPE